MIDYILLILGDDLEDDEFVNDYYLHESDNENVFNHDNIEENNWPFPDPNKDLDKYLTSLDGTYMEEFEKWWATIQVNKKRIADAEYHNLLRSSGIDKRNS